jgi:hypothetical protein
MRVGGTAEIEHAAPRNRYDVACAARDHHLRAKTGVGVARRQLLRFLYGSLDGSNIQRACNRNRLTVRWQYDAVAVWQVIGRARTPEVNEVAFKAFMHEHYDNLRKGHCVRLSALQTCPGNFDKMVIHSGPLHFVAHPQSKKVFLF